MNYSLPAPDPEFYSKRRARFEKALTGEGSFSLYERDPGDFVDLASRVPGVFVTSAGGSCPFQAEGRLLHYPFYFRFEWGNATLALGAPLSTELPVQEKIYYSGSYGAYEMPGGLFDLTREDFVEYFTACVKNLTRSPYLYSFAGRKVAYGSGEDFSVATTSEIEIYKGWGHNPTEALASLAEPSEWLIEKGISEEKQKEIFACRKLPLLPLKEDPRDFSEEEELLSLLREVI